MAAKTYLREVETLNKRYAPKFEDSKLKRASNLLKDKYGFTPSELPELVDIRQIYHRLLAVLDGEETFDTFKQKEWKLVPWAFIQPIDGNLPVFEKDYAIKQVLNYIKLNNRHQAINSLVTAFLMEYPVYSGVFENLRIEIFNLITEMSHDKVQKIKDWVKEFSLFDAKATDISAQKALKVGFRKHFQDLKLSKKLEFSNFAVLTVQKLLTGFSTYYHAAELVDQKSSINSLLALFGNKDNTLLYPTLRVDIADGILQTFGSSIPTKGLKTGLTEFFIRYYGDPRIKKAQWVGVSEEAMNVIRSWMVEDTMQDFFKLLSHVAKTDPMADSHWIYRKRFWNAYLEKGLILEAWVALGPTAQKAAKGFIGTGKSKYATLSGAQRNHSSLIIKIDHIIITEWSHSGKYRVWDTNSNKPLLYRRTYLRSALVNNCDYDGAHGGSHSGAWQYKLSTLINDLTGLKVDSREYMYD
jgi:hypothetical protein